ncbi:helix-turn-helix domain-containing protein [Streptomyces cinereospinus]|uniref:Helix-turn-helix domain-containing protein n=1 Tax=Streptomyces cinereospinus TaxID=285561 RepID=A0ABV5MXR5_9ACTN
MTFRIAGWRVLGDRRPSRTCRTRNGTAPEGWARCRSTPRAWALRCRIVLACAAGASDKDVAAHLGPTPLAVGRWRARSVERRIAGLGDMPRPGGPRTVSDEQVAAVVKQTPEPTPKKAPH